MNFRAIVNMVAPVLLSRIYALGSKRGRPELVFLFGALSSVTAECVWQSLSNVQLGLDRKGALCQPRTVLSTARFQAARLDGMREIIGVTEVSTRKKVGVKPSAACKDVRLRRPPGEERGRGRRA